MDTAEKIQFLKSNKGSSVKFIRGFGEEVWGLIMKVHEDGEDTMCTIMDIYEGVERTLSLAEISEMSADK